MESLPRLVGATGSRWPLALRTIGRADEAAALCSHYALSGDGK
jgi:hypothetical protein